MYSSDNSIGNSVGKHRHCFLLTGSTNVVLSDFLRLCKHLATPLICAHDVAQYDQLNVPSLRKPLFRTCSFKQTRQELGHTHDAILIDLTHGVSASALAILSGTVRGNGVFAIALPNEDWLSIIDQDLPRYLPWPYESKTIDSSFKRFLLNHLHNSSSPFQVIRSENIQALPSLPAIQEKAPLTKEQTEAQICLFKEEAESYVLIAPRGRGKSTLLGDSLAKMLQAGKKVALTAPNQSAVLTLKKRFEYVLTEVPLDSNRSLDSKGRLDLELPFFAPDALLANDTHWDMLFVDEASMIPVPLLMALNQKAEHCLFSTTDYGYEGAGKGFGIRFCQHLETQSTSKALPFQPLTLSCPIRWGENDPLENWINDCFFLAPNQALETLVIQSDTVSSLQNYKTITGAEWLTQTELLSRTFQLLVSAHYQTSPDNLRWILDDPSVSTYLSLQGAEVNSVAIITEEGQLPEELSLAVLQGTRRPRGHLIPQSLLAHEGIEDAGQYKYWRISRIATDESVQQQSYGSQLLTEIENTARQQKIDFLSASFAVTLDTLSFWQKNGFICVRLGTAKDQASGSYSVMMVKPLNQTAEEKASLWHQYYFKNLTINLPRDYRDIGESLATKLRSTSLDKKTLTGELTEKDKLDLSLFANYYRPSLTIRAQLTRLITHSIEQDLLSIEDKDYPLFTCVITKPVDEINLSVFGLKTKKQVECHLKEAVSKLLKRVI